MTESHQKSTPVSQPQGIKKPPSPEELVKEAEKNLPKTSSTIPTDAKLITATPTSVTSEGGAFGSNMEGRVFETVPLGPDQEKNPELRAAAMMQWAASRASQGKASTDEERTQTRAAAEQVPESEPKTIQVLK